MLQTVTIDGNSYAPLEQQILSLTDVFVELSSVPSACVEAFKKFIVLLGLKERVLCEVAEQLATKTEIAEQVIVRESWKEQLDRVSWQRLHTPEKQTLTAFHDVAMSTVTDDGWFDIGTREAFARKLDIGVSTLDRHTGVLVQQHALLKREHVSNGKNSTLYRIPDSVMENPFTLDKIISIGERREEKKLEEQNGWGGDRKKAEKWLRVCPECKSLDTSAHETGHCYKCGNDWITDITQNNEHRLGDVSSPSSDVEETSELTSETTDLIPCECEFTTPEMITQPEPVQLPSRLVGKKCFTHKIPFSHIGWNEWDGSPAFGCADCADVAVSA